MQGLYYPSLHPLYTNLRFRQGAAHALGDAKEALPLPLPRASDRRERAQDSAAQEADERLRQAEEKLRQAEEKLRQAEEQRRQAEEQQTRWFAPHGYRLAPECLKHEDLYLAVVDGLRPWARKGGITKADIEACGIPVAANASINGTEDSENFRIATLDNVVHITSGGLARGRHFMQPLYFHMLTQVQQAADKYGLPNVEFVVRFLDCSGTREPAADGSICPRMSMCKHTSHFDLLLPDGHFLQFMYDDWLEKTNDPAFDVPPWEERVEKAIGRFTLYGAEWPPKDRYGVSYENTREAYAFYSRDSNDTLTDLWGGGLALREQMRWKYTLNLDGIGCSTRFQKLLAMGQTVIKEETQLKAFFSYALQPWVHYAPTGYNGLDEIEGIVRFLKENDAIARKLGRNSKRFAHKHLTEEGRLCYIKVLFEEMNKLQRHKVQADDFPFKVSWADEVGVHFTEDDKRAYNERSPTL